MYQWAIKRYDGDSIIVNPKQAAFINKILDMPKDKRPEFFALNGEKYAYSGISSVTQTTTRVKDKQRFILSESDVKVGKKAPLLNEDGEVIAPWYKMVVSQKKMSSYYLPRPAYKLLDKTEGGNIWVAFRRAEHLNDVVPEHLVRCTEEESKKLSHTY